MLAGLATHATSQVGVEVIKHLSQGLAAALHRYAVYSARLALCAV